MEMKDENDNEKLQKAFERGEYILNEIEAFNKFYRYRKMLKAYSPYHQPPSA